MRELGAKIYACGPSREHFGVKRSELAYPDVIVGGYTVFLDATAGADTTIMLQQAWTTVVSATWRDPFRAGPRAS